jgi:DNA-binding transcriptional LysR family regulator
MHSRLLRNFLAVAERRNISMAARALNISQPTLTKSIHQLERVVGVPLFERHPNGVILTREGEVLARRARLMELEYRHALAEIGTIKQGLTGIIRIEAGPVWLTTILPPVVAAYHHQYPRIKVRLTGGVIDTMVPALLAGNIDLVCGTLDFPNHPELVKEPLVTIRHAVIASARHPLAGRKLVSAEALSSYPWIVLASDHVGTSRIGSFFVANGLAPPTIAIETITTAMMKILDHGEFLAHIPERMMIDAGRFGLVRIPHEGTFWESQAGVVYRPSQRPVRMIESFNAILRAHLAER